MRRLFPAKRSRLLPSLFGAGWLIDILIVGIVTTATPALAQSRVHHERRIRQLEDTIQQLIELQIGQSIRWAEMEQVLEATQRQLATLQEQVIELRRTRAEQEAVLIRQQAMLRGLKTKVGSLQAQLTQTQESATRRAGHRSHVNPQLAEVFRQRRPPTQASYYHPTGVRQAASPGPVWHLSDGRTFQWPPSR